jgi:hypothetical protein
MVPLRPTRVRDHVTLSPQSIPPTGALSLVERSLFLSLRRGVVSCLAIAFNGAYTAMEVLHTVYTVCIELFVYYS